jgi:hypothetical protein
MDRGQVSILSAHRRRRLLTAAAPLPLLLAAGADAPDLPIAEARWVVPEARFETLTRQPAECLSWPREPAARRSVAIGRAAFRAPLLLGGQAARAGLSCASCHRSGRGNPHFSFPGLSGTPGTADVTSSLMSSHRGDGTINPKPIPDLATGRRTIAHERQSRALETFIRGLIVEEFDGPEPPAAVLGGLADYVRAMTPAACRGAARTGLIMELAEVDAALAAARGADGDSMKLLVGAARSQLGRIDQRFQLGGLEPERALLRKADSDLAAIQRLGTATAPAAIDRWLQHWPAQLRNLRRKEARSLFDPTILQRSLDQAEAR